MRLLLDTNVLIDHIGKRTPFDKDFEKLYIATVMGDCQLWSTSNSYTDTFYVLRHGKLESSEIQGRFLDSADYIHICEVDEKDIIAAAQADWPDFEDCLVSVCADKIKADYIITRDVTGFAASKTPTVAPSEFLRILREDYGIVYEGFDLDSE
jgi:predicted nucleic acid-binding protein